MDALKNAFEAESCLKFTHEDNEHKLQFLYVSERIDNIFSCPIWVVNSNLKNGRTESTVSRRLTFSLLELLNYILNMFTMKS